MEREELVSLLDFLPLVKDIREEIKLYLVNKIIIPIPPLYGKGIVKKEHVVDTNDGYLYARLYDGQTHENYFSIWSNDNAYVKRRYATHSCGHVVSLIQGCMNPCFWCRVRTS